MELILQTAVLITMFIGFGARRSSSLLAHAETSGSYLLQDAILRSFCKYEKLSVTWFKLF